MHLHTDKLCKQNNVAVKLNYIDWPVDDIMKVHQQSCESPLEQLRDMYRDNYVNGTDHTNILMVLVCFW
jgi:ferric iron reductase protein FhuF